MKKYHNITTSHHLSPLPSDCDKPQSDTFSSKRRRNYSFLLFAFSFLLSPFSFLLSPFFLSAQITHEVSLNGGGGLGALNYKLSSGKKSLGIGGDVGVDYTCMFNKMVGLRVGAEIAFYNSKAKLNGVKAVTYNLNDGSESYNIFNMHTTLGNYKESQSAMFLNIPVMFQFQTGKVHKFYALAGVKIGIPVSGKYKVSGATLTQEGYYPELDNWLKDNVDKGFGVFQNRKSDGKLPLNISVAIALEAGMKWNISKMFSIYTGAYFDYGLNSISKKSGFVKMNYYEDKPTEFKTNSAIPEICKNMNPMAVGIKVRLALLPNGNNEVAKKEKGEGRKEKGEKLSKEKPVAQEKPVKEKIVTEKPEKQKVEKVKGEKKKKNKAEVVEIQEEVVETAKVEVVETPALPVEVDLTTASEFALGRPARAGFPATAMGISWVSNIDAVTAKFTTAPNALVVLPDQAAYQAITTQEKLKEAFEAGKKTSEFIAKVSTNFKPQYFIVQDGETLRLVEMSHFLIKAGESRANFTERR